ncbi:CaiB/BaiF CoA transferase family protein [Flexibacterium corallicola]|uniref:CaiB/BaiF CoA transferase family protein n=1 Tax=Flexibacterium corallicola TaxID=3037259 RepID=UPI00286F8324|nr:CoA transferase [Pseudovibrio sp. M1P-2-3]
MTAPLAGLRILAIEQYAAGPFGTQLLSDLGAEVIKIENRRSGGDYARTLGPYFAGDATQSDSSLFFQAVNRNKKSLCLDFTNPEGRKVLHKLVKGVDGVANNLRGDVPHKLGITYTALSDVNPAIVCAHCSGYGRTGPKASWPGYDYLMQARTGFFHMCGEPDTPPTRVGLSMVDYMTGTYMALGLLAGVMGARSTGKGRDIDVTLFDTALSNFSYLGVWALNSPITPSRLPRSAHPSLVPCQLFQTGDNWIYIMCNKEKFWPLLCNLIERPDLLEDPRFSDFPKRFTNSDALVNTLEATLKTRSTQDWLELFGSTIPCAPIKTPREAMDDPDLEETGRVETLQVADGTPFKVLSTPIKTTGLPESHSGPPLGADTQRILREAGFSEAEITYLIESGIT